MAYGEPPEKYALRINLVKVTGAVKRNLGVIGRRLVEEAFMTDDQLENIVDVLGVNTDSKAGQLMRVVEARMATTSNPEEWFETFVLILAKNTTEKDLVQDLVKDFGK